MFFHRFFEKDLAIASFMVADDATQSAVVIDPIRDVRNYIRVAKENGFTITHILETHVHADFASGAVELKHALQKNGLGNEVRIAASGMGGSEWTPEYADIVLKDGQTIELGNLRFQTLHTPGHTPEHVTYLLYDLTRSEDTPWLAFTGDFVFVGSVGRPDLLGEEERKQLSKQLYDSLFRKLDTLPDHVEVFPSHGAGSLCGKGLGSRDASTLGFERKFNTAFNQGESVQEWTDSIIQDMPAAPPYFTRMKQLNRTGAPILGNSTETSLETPLKTISVDEFRKNTQNKTWLAVDIRPRSSYREAHVPGSIHQPLQQGFSTWSGWFLGNFTGNEASDQSIVIISNDQTTADEARRRWALIGIDRVVGYIEAGTLAQAEDSAEKSGSTFEALPSLTVQELSKNLDQYHVLDVRNPPEWRAGHIDGATYLLAGHVIPNLDRLPKGKPIAIVCGSGNRSGMTASWLHHLGYSNVYNVEGGMNGWKKAGHPTKAGD